MTRTEINQSLHAQQRDRHIPRNGMWKKYGSVKKGGSGGVNWGKPGDEIEEIEGFREGELHDIHHLPASIKPMYIDESRVKAVDYDTFRKLKRSVQGTVEEDEEEEDLDEHTDEEH